QSLIANGHVIPNSVAINPLLLFAVKHTLILHDPHRHTRTPVAALTQLWIISQIARHSHVTHLYSIYHRLIPFFRDPPDQPVSLRIRENSAPANQTDIGQR